MQIVSWNMGCATKRYCKFRDPAWSLLLKLTRDVALIQEAMLDVPARVRDEGALFLEPAYGTQTWGSGIFVRPWLLARQIPISSPGSYVIAAEIGEGAAAFIAASVHVCPDKNQRASLRTLIDTLCPIFHGRHFVLGGDFNAARHWDVVYGKNVYGWFFDELASRGFHDAHFGLHGRETQSYWGRAIEKYQLDHFFVPASSRKSVQSCEVLSECELGALSDHSPILMKLEEAW